MRFRIGTCFFDNESPAPVCVGELLPGVCVRKFELKHGWRGSHHARAFLLTIPGGRTEKWFMHHHKKRFIDCTRQKATVEICGQTFTTLSAWGFFSYHGSFTIVSPTPTRLRGNSIFLSHQHERMHPEKLFHSFRQQVVLHRIDKEQFFLVSSFHQNFHFTLFWICKERKSFPSTRDNLLPNEGFLTTKRFMELGNLMLCN